MSEVRRHRRPLAERVKTLVIRLDDATDRPWFDYLITVLVVAFLLAVAAAGVYVLWTQTEGSSYDTHGSVEVARAYLRSGS